MQQAQKATQEVPQQPSPPSSAPQQQSQQLQQLSAPPLPANIMLSIPSSVPQLSQETSFVPPISLNPVSGMSLDRSFPHIESVLRLAIARHKFWLGHLFKLDSTMKEKPKPKTFKISDEGKFTQWERDASPKDYPSFCALYDSLVTYFELLQFFIISSGNLPAIHQITLGCC
jgi:hypothetical protein